MIPAYPCQWPDGWKRTPSSARKSAQFGTASRSGSNYVSKTRLSIAEAMKRVRYELGRMGVNATDDAVISTNLKLNMSGLPRGDQGEPQDPGVAVYWQQKGKPQRVMAIDAYSRVADNLGAIAATLEAMRAIERHGGAQILDRAFTGFTALPAPKDCWSILGLEPGASEQRVRAAWRELAAAHHPDRGGSPSRISEINAARDAALDELRKRA